MNDQKSIWKAFNKDLENVNDEVEVDEYLQDVKSASRKYMQNQSQIWDRVDVLSQLNEITSQRGMFAFLTGGPSIGKSLVLRSLVAQGQDHRGGGGAVLKLDGRSSHGTQLS
jgi:hypothetical protein